MKVLVLLNPKSGTLAASPTGDEPRRIADGFAARGVEADVRCLEADERSQGAAEAARDAAGRRAVGPASAASTRSWPAAGTGRSTPSPTSWPAAAMPFGVLPLGTHNHFAKELGVPLDLDEAVAALAEALKAGRTDDLDVAEVNGRVFLNFSAIGLHPQVVRQRDREHEALGRLRCCGGCSASC